MSNWVGFDLDVLAGSPAEINQIEAALFSARTEVCAGVASLFCIPKFFGHGQLRSGRVFALRPIRPHGLPVSKS
jgi:hypothetical protein